MSLKLEFIFMFICRQANIYIFIDNTKQKQAQNILKSFRVSFFFLL